MRGVVLSEPLDVHCAEALSLLLDLPEEHVRAVWAEIQSHTAYRMFVIHRGRDRLVHVPSDLLAAFQRRVLDRLLSTGPSSPAAFAGVRGRSSVMAAHRHLEGKGYVLRLDIRSAFGSTTWGHVAKAFRTRLKQELRVLSADREERARVAGVLAYLTTVAKPGSLARRLPLGAPTSVALFNLVCLPVDRAILRLRLAAGDEHESFVYTRYVDDMVLSHSRKFRADQVVKRVEGLLYKQRLRLNDRKTSLKRTKKAEVHGLCRTRRGVEPTKETRLRWVREIDRRTDEMLTSSTGSDDREAARAWLAGLDGYLRQVYEAQGLARPRELDIALDPSAERARPSNLDELWP